jgi:hypothetical protein
VRALQLKVAFMGASAGNLDVIASLYRRGLLPRGGAIADLGCSQLRDAGVDDLRRFFDCFGAIVPDEEIERLAAHNVFLTEHVKRAGFSYRAFDIVTAPDCEWLDLNSDRVPKRWRGHFDLVLNFGTTEHVLDQFNAFRTLHDLAKPGGMIYSLFLRGGNMDHGLLHYTDRFVDLLCEANCYDAVLRDDALDAHCTWMVMRKTSDEPFAAPVDGQYGGDFSSVSERRQKKPLLARLFG